MGRGTGKEGAEDGERGEWGREIFGAGVIQKIVVFY